MITAEQFADAIPEVVWYLDDPVADPALVPLYFVAREARKHVKVVLSGEGADELFGGYTIYREPLSLAWAERVPTAGRRAMGALSRAAARGACAARTCCAGRRSRSRSATTATRATSPAAELAQLLRGHDPDLSHVTVTEELYRQTREAGYDDVTAMQYVDLFTWLRGDILVKADKMTMANSLELRVPFLDPEVFALASTLPLDQRVPRGGDATKYALRRAMEQIVPEPILHRRKLGFPVPTGGLPGRPAARVGPADRRREPDRRVAGPGRGAASCSTRPAHRRAAEQADRPSGLGGAGLHGLARHLRRGADHSP